MSVLGPKDRRALRDTGRTWERPSEADPSVILSGPIMVDGYGRTFECTRGSIADFTNGRLDAILADVAARHPDLDAAIARNLGKARRTREV